MPTDMLDELTPYGRGEDFKPEDRPTIGWAYIKRLLAPPSHVELTYNSRSAKVFSPTTGENPTIAQLLEDHVPSLFGHQAVYTPAWALPSGDIQTIYHSYGPHTVKQDSYRYHRRYILLPDGGNLALDFTPAQGFGNDSRAKSPIVIVISGFLGGTHDTSIRETVMELSKPMHLGGPEYRVVVMNMRGCNTRLTSPGIEHAARTDDVRSTILYITSKYPGAQLFALGFQLGAAYVANYLGESGASSAISAGFCLSNMWDHRSCHAELGRNPLESVSRVIHNHGLGQKHRKLIAQNSDVFSAMVHPPHTTFPIDSAGKPVIYAEELKENINDILTDPFPTMTDITDRFIVPVSGFSTTKDFLMGTSSEPNIQDIRVPVLCLNAADDTLFKQKYFPYDLVKKSQHVVLAVTEKGGHAGFFTTEGVEGNEETYPTGLRRWYTTPIVEWFEAIRKTDPRPLAAPSALRPDSNGIVRCADDPAVGYKECSEQELYALPVSDKKVKAEPRKTNAMDVVVFFGWLFSYLSVVGEVFGATKFTFQFVHAVLREAFGTRFEERVWLGPPTPEESLTPESQSLSGTVLEVAGGLKFVLGWLKTIFKLSSISTPWSIAQQEENQRLRTLKRDSENIDSPGIYPDVSEVADASALTYNFVKDVIKVTAESTPRTAAQAKWEKVHPEQAKPLPQGGALGTVTELADATDFTFQFVKGVFTVVAESTPNDTAQRAKDRATRSRTSSVATFTEISDSIVFTFHFLKAVFRAFWEKPLTYTPPTQARGSTSLASTASEIADASWFSLEFVQTVFRVALDAVPSSTAQRQRDAEHPRKEKGLWSSLKEIGDASSFVLTYVMEVFRTVYHSTLPSRPIQLENVLITREGPSQSLSSAIAECFEASHFVSSFVKSVIKTAMDSIPYSAAQARRDATENSAGTWRSIKEAGAALIFVFDYVKEVFRTAWSSQLPDSQSRQDQATFAEVLDSLKFAADFVRAACRMTLASTMPEDGWVGLQEAVYAEFADIYDTIDFVIGFIKRVFRVASSSKLPSQQPAPARYSLADEKDLGITQGVTETVAAGFFVVDFIKGVFKLAFESKLPPSSNAFEKARSRQASFASPAEVFDSIPFVFNFLKEAVAMTYRSTLPAPASPSRPANNEAEHDGPTGAGELADILWSVGDFIKSVIELALKSDGVAAMPPVEPTGEGHGQDTVQPGFAQSINELRDATSFVFDFFNSLFKLAGRSKVPYATAQANWEKEHPVPRDLVSASSLPTESPSEIFSTFQFALDFVRAVIELAMKSTPACAQRPDPSHPIRFTTVLEV